MLVSGLLQLPMVCLLLGEVTSPPSPSPAPSLGADQHHQTEAAENPWLRLPGAEGPLLRFANFQCSSSILPPAPPVAGCQTPKIPPDVIGYFPWLFLSTVLRSFPLLFFFWGCLPWCIASQQTFSTWRPRSCLCCLNCLLLLLTACLWSPLLLLGNRIHLRRRDLYHYWVTE